MSIADEAKELAEEFEQRPPALESTSDVAIARLARMVEQLARPLPWAMTGSSKLRATQTLSLIALRATAYSTAMNFATLVNSGAGIDELEKAWVGMHNAVHNLFMEMK